VTDYRPLSDAEEPAFASVVSNAFRPASGPHAFDSQEGRTAVSPLGERRGLFEGQDLLAVCKHHPFTVRIGTDRLPMGGVAALAVPPENRRRGHARQLVAASLAEYRDREFPLAALWPFDHAFYAQFGWATATRYVRLETTPGTLAFARDERGGSFVRLGPDAHDRLDSVLAAHNAQFDVVIDRPEHWWRERVFDTWDGEPYVYGWERDGDLRAYVAHHIEESDGSTRLRTVESAWVDQEARLAVLSVLADHDSQVDSVRMSEPDAGLLEVAPTPETIDATVHTGPMIRLVDVAGALRRRSYPEAASGTAVIGVDDPLLDRNDGRFRLDFDGGEARVTPVSTEPGLTLGVGALSQLYVGYRSVDDVVRTRDATVHDDRARGIMGDAFPAGAVFLRERF
jgi:predicted acetyltransferase